MISLAADAAFLRDWLMSDSTAVDLSPHSRSKTHTHPLLPAFNLRHTLV